MDRVFDRPKKLFIQSRHDNPGMAMVEVRDHGSGLEDPEKVFEAFFTTKENGLGMGLSICRSIVEAHCGRLWATSPNEMGATFCFTLPVQAAAPAELRQP
jgi:signal transduction histidine kinase